MCVGAATLAKKPLSGEEEGEEGRGNAREKTDGDHACNLFSLSKIPKAASAAAPTTLPNENAASDEIRKKSQGGRGAMGYGEVGF